MGERRTLAILLPFLSYLTLSNAFSFNTSTPTQCGQWTVNWDGGQAPFHLILVPTETVGSGRIWNLSIPSNASNSYTFQLQQPSTLHFLATMSDATGFGSGGTTDTLQVGSSSDSSCLDNNLLYDFTFSVDPQSNPSQCSSMHVSWNDNLTYPASLYGLIPSGTAFSVPIPEQSGQASADWTVDINSGTQFLLFMSDSGKYQTGGSTSLLTVGNGNSNCMNSSSPHTGSATSASGSAGGSSASSGSASSAAASASGVGGSSSGGFDNNGKGSSNSGGSSHTGAIVGGTLGGVAFLALLGILAFFCLRRSRNKDSTPLLKSYGFSKEKPGRDSRRPMDLLGAGAGAGAAARRQQSDDSEQAGHPGTTNQSSYEPMPFRYPSPLDTRMNSNGSGNGRFNAMGQAENGIPGSPTVIGAMSEKGGRPVTSPTTMGQTQTRGQTPMGLTAGMQPPHPAYVDTTEGSSPDNSSHPSFSSMNHSSNHPHAPSVWGGVGGIANTGSTPHSGSEMGSDGATLGHAAARSDSTRKPPLSGTLPAGAADPAVPASPGAGGRPLPERPTTFIQHQDSGEIVDLPPRYDQLRARNPDSA